MLKQKNLLIKKKNVFEYGNFTRWNKRFWWSKTKTCDCSCYCEKSRYLYFDDSFSALDFKTDAKLRQELNQLVKKTKSTVLLVGQRIASIMDADQIIVLDEGRIVGKGTHDELMKSCQVYQEIAYSQLSKEELSHE